MRKAVFLFPLFMSLFYLHTGAQSVRWPARYFNTSNGLPQNTIRDIIQDDEGWLWIGTDNGLCIYDGYSFRMLDQMKGAEKLERGPTRFAKEKKSLWILQKQIIARYDMDQKQLDVYTVPAGGVEGITPVYIDSTKIIYYSFVNGYSFEKATGKVTTLITKKIPRVQVADVDHRILSRNHNYILATDLNRKKSDLILFNPATLTHTVQAELGWAMNSVCRLDSSFLYLGTNGRIYFSKNSRDRPEPVNGLFVTGNSYAQLQHIKLSRHEYLVGTGNDIFHVQLAPSFSIRRVTQTDGSPLIQKGKLLCFFKDTTGNVWIGTNAEGLVQVPRSGNTFTLYRSSKPEKNFIRSIHTDTFTNNIWAGLYFDNIVVFDRYGLEKMELTQQVQKMLGKHNVINYIHQLNRNELLVFAELEKTYHINLANNTITTCKIIAADAVKHRNNQLYIGSIAFIMPLGRDRYMRLYDDLLVIASYSNKTLYLNRMIRMPDGSGGIYKVNDNRYWIGSKGKALLIDSTGTIMDSLVLSPEKKVNAIVLDTEHALWLATNSGIYIYKDRKLVKTLLRKDGLPDDYFYTLASDTTGFIWGSTNSGLMQIDIRSFRFRNFTEKDGLQGNEFNTGAVHQAKDGRIFFGGISGLNAFYPFSYNTPTQQQRVHFTGITSDDSTLFNPIDPLPQQISFPDGLGNLVVSFSAFNFQIHGANEYEYRLNNKKEWLSTSGRNVIQLFLTPGGYILQVRLKDKPASVALLHIKIEPPFYRTWWFILLGILSLSMIAALIIYVYTRGKYQKQIATLAMREKVQQEKERISRELHDDLGVKANLLSYNASLLMEQPGTENKTAIGTRIKDAADDMLLALRETMWTLKQEHINTGEAWVRFKNFISKMQRTYHHINFVIEKDCPMEKMLAYNDALNLVRIMQEAVNNAIRHSGSAAIYCSAETVNHTTVFSIRDEGNSFSESEVEPGDGLFNMRYRASQSGFNLEIQTLSGKATTVTIRV
jgi:signal transduction histidine kinase